MFEKALSLNAKDYRCSWPMRVLPIDWMPETREKALLKYRESCSDGGGTPQSQPRTT